MMPSGKAKMLMQYAVEAVSNDYEDFNMIVREARRWAASKKIQAPRPEILRALEDAIEGGYVRAYVLSAKPPCVRVARYSRGLVDDLSFYVTAKGKDLVRQLMEQ